VKTLKDYLPEAKRKKLGNPDWVGMIEQVVAANGRVFVGTYWSTFTAFIVRMRGYQVGFLLQCTLHACVACQKYSGRFARAETPRTHSSPSCVCLARPQGLATQSYYALPQYRDVYVHGDDRRKGAGWWREWPEAWEDIESD
jgi:hypothetical protein